MLQVYSFIGKYELETLKCNKAPRVHVDIWQHFKSHMISGTKHKARAIITALYSIISYLRVKIILFIIRQMFLHVPVWVKDFPSICHYNFLSYLDLSKNYVLEARWSQFLQVNWQQSGKESRGSLMCSRMVIIVH